MSQCVGVLIVNCGEIAHMASGDASQPLVGAQMVDRGQNTLPSGQGIVIFESTIERIDDSESLQSEFAPWWDGSDSKSFISCFRRLSYSPSLGGRSFLGDET